jgi:octopine/nopaline transport system ATP-binding protein
MCYRLGVQESVIAAARGEKAGTLAPRAPHAAGPDAIRVEDLHKSFGPIEVLKGVSLRACEGDVISVIGSSGSGKSTFLRCINLLEMPDSGRIAIRGEEVRLRPGRRGPSVDRRQVERLRARLSMVFQSFNLWPHRTVLGNVIEAPVHVLNEPRKEAIERAEAILERVGLYDKRDVYPAFLSGGQQQRAAIARALAMRPHAILFDEPTSALDPELVGEVLRVIRDLAEEGRTMIIVTHEMSFARDVSSHVMFLHRGLVEEEGPPRKVLSNPESERCRAFVSAAHGSPR